MNFSTAPTGRDGPFKMHRALTVLILMLCFNCAPNKAPKKEKVFLLHGMGRSTMSMLLMKSHLNQSGFEAESFPYSAAKNNLDQITDDFLKHIKENTEGKTYHLIGHSLGNIIIRNGFKKTYPPGLGRIVMLAPPNHPQDAAKAIAPNPIYKMITGDSGQKLGDEDFYRDLPVPSVEFGVIAGDKGPEFVFGEPNDFVVTVESTKLNGMKEHLVLPRAHALIMNSADVKSACVNFIKNGSFKD